MSDIDRKRLFIASCVAVATTGIVFSIRGDILDALGTEFRRPRSATSPCCPRFSPSSSWRCSSTIRVVVAIARSRSGAASTLRREPDETP